MDPESLAKKYYGDMCETYDSLREVTPQWVSEQKIVQEFLKKFPAKTSVLDIPVGTGRFFETYLKFSFKVVGIDISDAMLEKAQKKADTKLQEIRLEKGNIFSLNFPDNKFDVVVCVRFMDWVGGKDFDRALSELARVSFDTIIVYIPTYTQISEIKPFSYTGICRLLRQFKLKFYMNRTKSESVIHEKSDVYRLIDRLGLQVMDKVCIDQPGRYWKRGHERDIYLLQKTKGRANLG